MCAWNVGSESAQAHLAELDGDWRRKLAVVSLVAEALDSIDANDCEWAFTYVGKRYAHVGAWERVRLLRRRSAVQVVITAYVAAERYDQGGLWPQLKKFVPGDFGQTFNREWGEAFLANLEELGMPTFLEQGEEAGQRFVGRMLLHCGVPTFGLGDLYRLIGEWRRRDRGLQPRVFVGRAAARYADGTLYGVDKPVGRFLRFGGEYAVDVVDRVFDLLDDVSTGGEGADVPLPARFKRVAAALHSEGATFGTPGRRRGGTSVEHGDRPRLAIEPFGRGLLLRLPAVGDAPGGAALWSISIDEAVTTVRSRSLLPGAHEPAPEVDVPIAGPVRLATAELEGHVDLSFSVPVVDEHSPLLAFGEDGVQIPTSSGVPGAATWLLFAGAPTSLEVDDSQPGLLSYSPLPPGWADWSLLSVDLTKASMIRLRLPDHGVEVPVRARPEEARIALESPVLGVRNARGMQVYAGLPNISLPPSLAEANWQVRVLDRDGVPIAAWTNDAGDADPNKVWDQIPAPAFGTFTVRVRGPWGRGASRTVSLVEGLTVRFTPRWRRFVPEGLTRCLAQVSVPDELDLSDPSVSFDGVTREASVRISAHGYGHSLLLTPPHMAVAYESAESVGEFSIRRLELFHEDLLASAGTLVIRLGPGAEPRLHVLAAAVPVQQIEPSASHDGVYRFDLRRVTETLSGRPKARLALDPDGQMVVAEILPRKLFSRVEVVDGRLEFADAVDVEGLTAYVYPTRAPWRPPVALAIECGAAGLPADLVDAGPLRVLVRIEDPWAPEPAPDLRRTGTSPVIQSGYVVDEDAEATALSAYLAGAGDFPPMITDWVRLWRVRSTLGSLWLDDRIVSVRETIDRALAHEPRVAIMALMSAGVLTNRVPELVVRTGIAYADLRVAHEEIPTQWTKATAIPATLLSAADEQWSDDEIEAAVAVCGDLVSSVLAGSDPEAVQGRFDENAKRFDAVPQLRDEILRHLRLVPTGLLSGDSRVMAAIKLIERRRDPGIGDLLNRSDQLLRQLEYVLQWIGDERAIKAFGARRTPTETRGWMVLPALSLGFALVARHAARRNQQAGAWLAQEAQLWGDLAEVAPDLVTIDLILAELLVAGGFAAEADAQ